LVTSPFAFLLAGLIDLAAFAGAALLRSRGARRRA
jgi:hypothetical protein